jgi:hypothetical protein
MATEEKRMPDELKPEASADFVADFREGEAMAREWIAGRGDLPDLLHVVRDMPRGGAMGGLEAGFLSTIDAAVRGDRRGETGAPDPAKAQLLLQGSLPEEAQAPTVDVDEFLRRRRERELAARLQELGRRNAQAWQDQSAFMAGLA